jgi:hypothetical protein
MQVTYTDMGVVYTSATGHTVAIEGEYATGFVYKDERYVGDYERDERGDAVFVSEGDYVGIGRSEEDYEQFVNWLLESSY